MKIGNIVEVSESDAAGGQRTFEFVFIDGQEEIVWLNENGEHFQALIIVISHTHAPLHGEGI